ncbi:AAEL000239-PA [Aedes aegypti]|uniref:AAEL000239-PA n=1 Tax=Aedes aegypti TaxID=7159 RepID=Q17PU7_AEDAE|nr:AAEL000239-PA [Aedes aegypti]
MANPFLMDDEPMGGSEPVSNPFLFDDDGGATGVDDNPFLAQASNPFADFGGEAEEPIAADTAPNMNDLFGTAGVNAVVTTGAEIFGVSEAVMAQSSLYQQPAQSNEELKQTKANHKAPPPRPIPPSQATQQLISSIADQLDQTSTNLLRQIPATRTPSPVSMRDLHSPSPTPDFGDLLSVGEQFKTEQQNQQDDLFGTGPLPATGNDNPFAEPAVPIAAKPEVPKPPRPRPPPPRPAPPRSSLASSPVTAPPPIPQPPAVAPTAQPQQEADLFDLFGPAPTKTAPPKPPAPKTKEDILSLFSTPAPAAAPAPEPKQPDLLSGDFDDIFGGSQEPTSAEAFVPNLAENLVEPEPAAPPVIEQPMVEPSPEIVLEAPPPSDELISRSEASSDFSPTGSNVTSGNIPSSVSGSIVNIAAAEKVDELPEMEPEAMADYPAPPPVAEPEVPMEYNHVEAVPVSTVAAQLFYAEPETTIAPVAAETINPFAMDDDSEPYVPSAEPIVTTTAPMDYANELFGNTTNNNLGSSHHQEPDAFDSFAAKFDLKTSKSGTNIFLDGDLGNGTTDDAFGTGDAWGAGDFGGGSQFDDAGDGFGNEGDDPFLSMQAPPVPEVSAVGNQFNVVIRPKEGLESVLAPALAPPPKSPQTASIYSGDSSPRVNPFDRGDDGEATLAALPDVTPQLQRTDSQETPPTPLFDEDVSQPLEDFPRVIYHGGGWEMQLRQPNKKKITGQRFWKKIYIRLVFQGDNPVLQLFNAEKDKDPFQELPLQACYSVSEIGAQQYDNFGKIFTVKLQYVFYKERPGVRPGQVTKAERLTNKLSQFAAYAIQGDYQGVKELGSDLKKLGLPVEHAPQISQLFKLGSMNYEDMKQFSVCIEEALFKMSVHRDRALTYKMEEVQVTAVDELYVEQDAEGHVHKQIARVRLFFLAFLSGMPDIELGVNDLWRQGKEVVGRHDIIPVVTEEWIRLEGVEFHTCVQQDEYERSRTIKFKPPDACYIELMRFRIRPPKNRELPLQLKATWCVTGNKVELRADVLVPGFASRKLGQIPCEDVSIRFPIPECWIYLFRVEKHFRYGSVKSAHRRTGKIKGIERFLGTVETLQESLIEVTSGQAKYEHHHRAIVWRCSRLPKEGQGAYTTHQLVCRMALTSFDQIPEQLAPYAYVEFTMPATQASHTTVRSISVQESESDEPPEKYVRYLARHEYRVGIEHTTGESVNAYLAATAVTKPIQEEQPMATTPIAPSDSDSDSN